MHFCAPNHHTWVGTSYLNCSICAKIPGELLYPLHVQTMSQYNHMHIVHYTETCKHMAPVTKSWIFQLLGIIHTINIICFLILHIACSHHCLGKKSCSGKSLWKTWCATNPQKCWRSVTASTQCRQWVHTVWHIQTHAVTVTLYPYEIGNKSISSFWTWEIKIGINGPIYIQFLSEPLLFCSPKSHLAYHRIPCLLTLPAFHFPWSPLNLEETGNLTCNP